MTNNKASDYAIQQIEMLLRRNYPRRTIIKKIIAPYFTRRRNYLYALLKRPIDASTLTENELSAAEELIAGCKVFAFGTDKKKGALRQSDLK
jgi:hypothetical protein